MKKILLALAFVVLMASSVWAAGSCVLKSSELVYGNNSIQKKIVKLTCTGDGSITAYSFDPGTFGVRGWYLYSVTIATVCVAVALRSPIGTTQLTVVACDDDPIWGEVCSDPVPFTYTRPAVPAITKGIRLIQ